MSNGSHKPDSAVVQGHLHSRQAVDDEQFLVSTLFNDRSIL